MTKAEHDRQRDRVRASELRTTSTAEAHGVYIKRPGGWRAGQMTPPRPPVDLTDQTWRSRR